MSGKKFGLRTFSGNFDHEDMKKGIEFARSNNVKTYVTMNIMATQEDMAVIDDEIDFVAHEAKADAVLVSDPGIFARVREVAPGMQIHISTQASTTNSEACKFWYRQGASRIVLAREVSLEQIRKIKSDIPSDLEIECFVHGAMCMAYSGRCMLSNYFTGRRANGGACAQPCRWGYTISEEKRPEDRLPVEEDQHGTYILSSKDLCMIDHIPEMIEAGIDSLKIEGRIKGAYYAASATKVYREAVDLYLNDPEGYKADPAWSVLLDKVVHRDYHTGFFFTSPSEDAAIGPEKTYNKPAFVVCRVDGYDEDKGLYRVSQINKAYKGDTLNVLKPQGYEPPVRITEMYNGDMEPVDSAPHPKMTFFIKLDRQIDLPVMSFLSRDGDKDEGILPST